MFMKILKFSLILILAISVNSCGFYSVPGAETGTAETCQVNFFQNNAPLIEPGLDIEFTNALQDLIQNQTKLSLVTTGGDLIYEGEIVIAFSAPDRRQALQRQLSPAPDPPIGLKETRRRDNQPHFDFADHLMEQPFGDRS